jgi:hypothetical protein
VSVWYWSIYFNVSWHFFLFQMVEQRNLSAFSENQDSCTVKYVIFDDKIRIKVRNLLKRWWLLIQRLLNWNFSGFPICSSHELLHLFDTSGIFGYHQSGCLYTNFIPEIILQESPQISHTFVWFFAIKSHKGLLVR